MAAGATCKRVGQLVANSHFRRFGVSNVPSFESAIFKRSVRKLEGQRVPSNQAEAITSIIAEVLNDSLKNVEMIQERNFSKFISEDQSSQEKVRRQTEKIRMHIDKVRCSLKFLIRDELTKQSAETTNLTNKLNREIHALGAHVEATNNSVKKFGIRTLVFISSVVGLAELCILIR